jgi:prepilin-type N-terminal cleavage/methylation domain-containing protein
MARRGFTLVEAMVALAVFGAFTSLMVTIFPLARKIVTSGNQLTVAADLMQAKIESLRQIPYGDLTVGTYESNVHADTSTTSPYYKFTHTVTVTRIDDNLNTAGNETGLKLIQLTTTWVDPLRGSLSKTLYTIVTTY